MEPIIRAIASLFRQAVGLVVCGVLGSILLLALYKGIEVISGIDINKEVIEKQNLAAAIILAAILLGGAVIISFCAL